MKYHFFYHGFLSNFHICSFVDEGKTFTSVEQYMMYHKAVLFKDEAIAIEISKTDDPLSCKRLGRLVSNFNQKKWDAVKFDIVKRGVTFKFEQNESLKEQLLAIDCDEFAEASPFDNIWGIGMDESTALQNPLKWGENLLGKILTDVRNRYDNRSKSLFSLL